MFLHFLREVVTNVIMIPFLMKILFVIWMILLMLFVFWRYKGGINVHEFINKFSFPETDLEKKVKYDSFKFKSFRFLPDDLLMFDVIKGDLIGKMESMGLNNKVTEIDVLRSAMKAYIEKNNL